MNLNERDAARFWSKVDRNGPIVRPELGPCWVWTGSKQKPSGYGYISVGGKQQYAHRLVLGVQGRTQEACHHCDNPPCVREDHLFRGTRRENALDAAGKGRMASGERHWARKHPERVARGDASTFRRHPELVRRGEDANNKLTAEQVSEIRSRYQGRGGITQRELAEEYGVVQACISHIVRGKSWAAA